MLAVVFYMLAAVLNVLAVSFSLFGLFSDCNPNKQALPSQTMWMLIVSSIFQLITISVYGGCGIGDYSKYQPDYSLIIASVALGFNFICAIFFLIEIVLNHKSNLKS